MSVGSAQTKILVLLLGLMFSLVVGFLAGILAGVAGAAPVGAVFQGGGACAACMSLWLAAMAILSRS
ncbi:hypothetical protein TUSST3_65860 [Streptomyces sp. TUS-ST3]|nr:hypothetical protein TUSST3_65860 [Streptomyces sp. TUS-ST3]